MLPPVCYRITKPQTFADCIGNELPLGWEESYDSQIGVYYINHVNRKLHFHFYPHVSRILTKLHAYKDML